MYDVCEGVTVVEVASWTFVPTAGAVLADWGADVLKIEHPVSGDPQRGLKNVLTGSDSAIDPMLQVPNRGKRSVAIDISLDGGRELLYRLVRNADVFTTNYLPGVREKLHIDVDDIRAQKPDIIYGRGSAHGIRGAEAARGGFDFASSWARAGTAYALATPGSVPPYQPGSFGDLCGGLNLAGAVAAALFRRERTGRGSVVDASLYATGMWMMAQSISGAPLGREMPVFTRETTWNPLTSYYPTKDDRWICLAMLQADRWWPDLARHLGREDLIADARFASAEARLANRTEFVATLDEIFRTQTLDEWRRILATTEGVWAPVLSPAEIAEDPQVRDNGFFPDVETGDGTPFRIVAGPAQFDGEPVGTLRRAPEHGEHTEEVLLELGLDWDDIIALKEAEVIL
jgi:crotonobetainyl-CoA:carnitine CoA-transferase CaiB-like acyl-CoA transferase